MVRPQEGLTTDTMVMLALCCPEEAKQASDWWLFYLLASHPFWVGREGIPGWGSGRVGWDQWWHSPLVPDLCVGPCDSMWRSLPLGQLNSGCRSKETYHPCTALLPQRKETNVPFHLGASCSCLTATGYHCSPRQSGNSGLGWQLSTDEALFLRFHV